MNGFRAVMLRRRVGLSERDAPDREVRDTAFELYQEARESP
jgi:uncharacterized protein (UPF0335 family)